MDLEMVGKLRNLIKATSWAIFRSFMALAFTTYADDSWTQRLCSPHRRPIATDAWLWETDPTRYHCHTGGETYASLPLQPDGLAGVYYEGADTDKMPKTTANYYPGDDGTCTNDPLAKTIPYLPITPKQPDVTQVIEIDTKVNSTGHLLWTINNSSARVDYNDAVYLLANQGNISYPYDPQWNVYDFFNNDSVRLVINNKSPVAHPIHLHGHNMYVIDEGSGPWDGVSVARHWNPQRRDTQMLRPNGHVVIQYDADNPGAWPVHCHIAWHVSMGFYLTVMERPREIARARPPHNAFDACRRWNRYTRHHVPDQIDSGV